MRVGILGLQHESNSFITTPTTLEHFRADTLAAGEDIRRLFKDAPHEVGGFFEGLGKAGIEAVPLFFARAMPPGGEVTDETLDQMMAMMLDQLDRAGRLDGLLLAPHGAAVSTTRRDMDGYWTSVIRQRVGPAMPIVSTLDPHVNLSQKMVDAVNATVIYRTNPHLIGRERGLEAADLLARMLSGKIRPTQAAAFPPVVINIERQKTAEAPCTPLYELADSMRKTAGVLSVSIALGFAYSDVVEVGSAFVIVTDNDPLLARRLVNQLASYLVAHRAEFDATLIGIEQAVEDAAGVSRGPVTLLDMGDNVGGGAPGDGTALAQAIHRRGGPKSFIMLWDPRAQAAARAAGVGNQLRIAMGGHSDPVYGPALNADVTVRGLYDGQVRETQVRHGGFTFFDMGPTAVVETATALTALLTTNRTYPSSLQQLIACGLDPMSFSILIAKGVHAPVGAYGPISTKLIRVNTPGFTAADLSNFTYEHRRRPLFPFEDTVTVG